ncbi:hypothetical protein [Paraburkholderia rhizosphaerae]|uniref:Uncharacterized protein n=1 Tax=Paraburkholderia rhizosphaerae TaxID=480658 RepID=A0A4R8LG10_9BURK|nr:hypothetical protein [Paraburkholderia rhizosphaerae]TDY42043.1 hypothetical protein BX592_12329 [Paraburkholderia rhizosphaerae]
MFKSVRSVGDAGHDRFVGFVRFERFDRYAASAKAIIRAALCAVVLALALSGCSTFCGMMGGSGDSGFAGGCSTGVRF